MYAHCALLLITLAAAGDQGGTAVPANAERQARREQLTTMRLLLVEELGAALRGLDADSAKRARTNVDVGGDIGVLWYELEGSAPLQRTTQTRAFYALGLGALFTTEVAVPARPLPAPLAMRAPQENLADAWERARRQVRQALSQGNEAPATSGRHMQWVMDDVQMTAAIDAVIRIVAQHGMNITHVPSDEAIVVAMRFVPWVGSFRPPSGSKWTNGGNLLALVPQAGLLLRRTQPAEPRHVVIRISLKDLSDYQAQRIDFASLKEKLVISDS